jgi:hypothetical protein
MFSTDSIKATKAAAIQRNLFSVRFSDIPTLTDNEYTELEFTTKETILPGSNTGFGSAGMGSWYVSIILSNLSIFDAFREWARQTKAERIRLEGYDEDAWKKTLTELGAEKLCASATLSLFAPDGTTVKQYKLTGLEIESVSDVDLSWATPDSEAVSTYSVYFKYQFCEPVA